MSFLEIEHITKAYRKGVNVNDDISLKVEAGQVYGLLGPNGAGKTTLVSQIIGLVSPTSGNIKLDGIDLVANPAYARNACSFQPQAQAPIDGLTLRQAVELIGRMRGGRKQEIGRRVDDLFESLDIEPWADKQGQFLSGGIRRLAAFCMAIVVPGRLVILDEPTNDVDPLRRRLLWEKVRQIANEGSTVLLVTHNMLEAERSVDRLAIINQGKVAAAGSPASLKNGELDSFRLELILDPVKMPPSLPDFLSKPVKVGQRLITQLKMSDVNAAVAWARHLTEEKMVEEFSLGPATLEDLYVRIVGQEKTKELSEMEVRHELSTALVS